MKNILALVDNDSKTTNILDTAFRFAEENSAQLTICHHLSKDEEVSINDGHFSVNGDNTISNYSEMYKKAYKVAPIFRFTSGRFKKEVIELIKQEDIDLIIMGSNGISNTIERVLGSHAEYILENALCSVLILKDVPINHSLNEIVFASSFNEMDKEIFQYFLSFLKLPKNTLIHLLMIDTYSFFNQPTILIKETLAEFEKLARPYSTKSHFFHGISIENGIKKFMNKEKPDLLVMSNMSSSHIKSALVGSKMVATLHQNQYPFLNIDYEKSKKEA